MIFKSPHGFGRGKECGERECKKNHSVLIDRLFVSRGFGLLKCTEGVWLFWIKREETARWEDLQGGVEVTVRWSD